MIRNYFKIAIRNLIKNKTASLIHILGLSIGIVSAIFIAYYVQFEQSYESMHARSDNVYRLYLDLYNGDAFEVSDVETYQTFGPDFKETFPEVLDYARFFNMGEVEMESPSRDYKSVVNQVYFADPSLFNLFSYQILDDNNIKRFEEPNTIILTESLAKKYFNKSEAVGETLLIKNVETPFEVVGVIEDLPQNTHLKFDMLLSHATIPILLTWYEQNKWTANNEYTYLLVAEGTDINAFNSKLKAYSDNHELLNNMKVAAERISDIHLYSNKTFEPEVNGSALVVNYMFGIGIFILLLAWINYINLSTAKAMLRAKEVGVRKAIGSSKSQLIRQFFCEAFLVNFAAVLFSLLMSQLLFTHFKNFTGQQLTLEQFGYFNLIYLIAGLTLIGTFISGFYPALVLSDFNPSLTLKGKFSNSAKGIILRKGLVFFQFSATVVLLCVAFAIYSQVNFLSKTDLGVQIDDTLVIRTPNTSDSLHHVLANSFRNQLDESSLVAKVTQTESLPGADYNDLNSSRGINRLGADEQENKTTFYHFGVKPNYLDVMGIGIVAGKSFEDSSAPEMIMINDKAREALGFEDAGKAIGESVTYHINNRPAEIIGVFDNFHQRSPKENHLPMILRNASSPKFFIVKLETQDSDQALAMVNTAWQKVYQDEILDYFFLDDMYNQQYANDQQFGKSVVLFTLLSILIAGLGLFGLSSFMISLKEKEIGVRKVLGATTRSLVALISKSYSIIILAAGIVSVPVAYVLIQSWLENYAQRIELDWWLFVLPVAFILLIALLTVGSQTLKAAIANPIASLKNE